MTYREALREFKAVEIPQIENKYGKKDKPAKSEAWVGFIDYLEKDGQITETQAAKWDNPFNPC